MSETDRDAIIRLARCMTRAMDRRTISDLDDLMIDEVEVVYGFGQWRGRSLHQRIFEATLPRCFATTQHLLGNAIVEVDAGSARAEYVVHATHLVHRDGPVGRVGLTYQQDLILGPTGWRIARHQASTHWIDDPGGVMPAPMTRMAAAIEDILARSAPI